MVSRSNCLTHGARPKADCPRCQDGPCVDETEVMDQPVLMPSWFPRENVGSVQPAEAPLSNSTG